MLTGNLVAISLGGIISVVWSLIAPENFDFEITRAINRGPAPSTVSAEEKEEVEYPTEKKEATPEHKTVPVDEEHAYESAHATGITPWSEIDHAALGKAFRFATWSSLALTLVLVIIIPLALFGSSVVYGVAGFGAWVIIGFIWAFFAAFTVVLYPLYESRLGITMVFKGIVKDMFKPGSGKYEDPVEEAPSA